LDPDVHSENLITTFEICIHERTTDEVMKSLTSLMLKDPHASFELSKFLLSVDNHPQWLDKYHQLQHAYPPFVWNWLKYYDKVWRREVDGDLIQYPPHFLSQRPNSSLIRIFEFMFNTVVDDKLVGSADLRLPDESATEVWRWSDSYYWLERGEILSASYEDFDERTNTLSRTDWEDTEEGAWQAFTDSEQRDAGGGCLTGFEIEYLEQSHLYSPGA